MKRILIIEDDRDIVEFVRYNLANEGLRVTAVADSLVREVGCLLIDAVLSLLARSAISVPG